jgi:hypothetical protein
MSVFSDLLRHTLDCVPAPTTLVRWPDAADILGVNTRRVLDLIVSGELEPVRLPDDLYVRRDQVYALRTRGV